MALGDKKSLGGANVFAKPTYTDIAKMDFGSKQRIALWGPPVTGKTDGIVKLVQAGYAIDYVNLDDNVRPFLQLTPEELVRVNNIKLKDGLSKFNIADFFENIRSTAAISICKTHGHINCNLCKKGGEFLMYNPSKSVADITVIDSASAYLDSAMISAKENATEKTTFNNFGIQGLHVDVLHHFVKSVTNHVIVICHDIQLANTLKENYTDNYYPLLGTRPKSKRSMNIYSAVIRSYEARDTYQVSKTKTHFATLRNSELEQQLNGKSRIEILKAILGPPKNYVTQPEIQP